MKILISSLLHCVTRKGFGSAVSVQRDNRSVHISCHKQMLRTLFETHNVLDIILYKLKIFISI